MQEHQVAMGGKFTVSASSKTAIYADINYITTDIILDTHKETIRTTRETYVQAHDI